MHRERPGCLGQRESRACLEARVTGERRATLGVLDPRVTTETALGLGRPAEEEPRGTGATTALKVWTERRERRASMEPWHRREARGRLETREHEESPASRGLAVPRVNQESRECRALLEPQVCGDEADSRE